MPASAKLIPIQNLAQYQPQAFVKLGNIGREIHQIAGLTCAKGIKAVERGFEVIKNYPQIVHDQQLLGEMVWYGNKCLNASNNYLRKISSQYLKSILDPEHFVMRVGNQIKKIPKNCLIKTKQWLDEDALVVDTLGNRWASKIGSDEWHVNLSTHGKQSLTLLNEAVASGAETISVSRKVKHRIINYETKVKQVIKDNHYERKSLLRNKYANTTFGEFYGPKVTEFLQRRSRSLHQKILHLDGIDHLLLPSITQKLKKSGSIKESIVGFHLDIERKLEQAGMYTLKNCKKLVGDFYEAELHFEDIFKKGKTFLPSHWDCEKLIIKISEACHNAREIINKGDGILDIKGIVEEGFEILVRINKRGKILTVYPL